MTSIPWTSTHLDRVPASIDQVAHDSIGLYVAPPVSHLEFAARVPRYRASDLEDGLAERRFIGLRCLRGSAFLMPVDLLPVVVAATRDRNIRAFGRYLETHLTTASYEEWVERVEGVIEPGEAVTKAEITARLDPPAADRPYMTNLVSQMATESRLIGLRVAASWRSARIEYTRWADWLPDVDVFSLDRESARAELATLYLTSHGPASIHDFSWWSGLTVAQARAAFAAIDCISLGDLWDVEPSESQPPQGVRLLPIWDALFVTWKDRSRFIPDELLPYVYDASGNATSVVLVDGVVAGVWATGPDGAELEVRVAPFDRFTRSQWQAIEDEAAVIATLSGADSARLVRCTDPPDLREGRRNQFMSPV